MRALVVFYKGYCKFCHQLINDPIETTAKEHGAGLLFIDAEKELTSDNPFTELFDPSRGVPQTVLADVTPVARVIGYQPQPEHSAALG